ncbi:MAG: DUF493 family protein [Neisseria sp.]|nr:DUF493 family protein [Neisseria sp.]
MSCEIPELIEFPCTFPIKVMGAAHERFSEAILEAVRVHAPDTQAHQITLRSSSAGNYVGATVSVQVFSREQLDNIYRTLTAHKMVKVVL